MLPQKQKWKEQVPYGISASTFGHALGLLGCVSDFVAYQRHYYNTELAFTGNEATQHGIDTEATARTVYEMLTRQNVDEGGFYIYKGDRRLACSPDGIVWARDANGQPTTTIKRLLEIKSPFKALYDCTKPSYLPFGIPQQYMCQMQGQMAISGATECDFFVYLHHPEAQVECWRVKFSQEFWDWAEPKLHKVSWWLEHGPTEELTRSFNFGTFNYAVIEVEPLIAPVVLATGMAIRDSKRFPWFVARHSPPVAGLRSSGIRLVYGAQPSKGAVVIFRGERCALVAIDMNFGFVELFRSGGWVSLVAADAASGGSAVRHQSNQVSQQQTQGTEELDAPRPNPLQITNSGNLCVDIRYGDEIEFVRQLPGRIESGTLVQLSHDARSVGRRSVVNSWFRVVSDGASASGAHVEVQAVRSSSGSQPIGEINIAGIASVASEEDEGERFIVPRYVISDIYNESETSVGGGSFQSTCCWLSWPKLMQLLATSTKGAVVVSSLSVDPDKIASSATPPPAAAATAEDVPVYLVPTHVANWLVDVRMAGGVAACEQRRGGGETAPLAAAIGDAPPDPLPDAIVKMGDLYAAHTAASGPSFVAVGVAEPRHGWRGYFYQSSWESCFRKVLSRNVRSSPLQSFPGMAFLAPLPPTVHVKQEK